MSLFVAFTQHEITGERQFAATRNRLQPSVASVILFTVLMRLRSRKVMLIALLLLALGVIAVLLLRRSPREPIYQGRPLRAWLEEFSLGYGTTNEVAKEAIRAMGTNALPALIGYLRVKDPPYYRQRLRLQAKLGLLRAPVHYAVDWHIRAATACGELGQAGAPAFAAMAAAMSEHHAAADDVAWALSRMLPASAPVLTNVLATGTETARCRAADALITTSWHPAIEEMCRTALLRAMHDPYYGVRATAASALSHWSKHRDVVVAALTEALRDPHSDVRGNAATSLGNFGADAKSAVPELVKLLQDTNSYVGEPLRERARAVLLKIDPSAVSTVADK